MNTIKVTLKVITVGLGTLLLGKLAFEKGIKIGKYMYISIHFNRFINIKAKVIKTS